MRSRPSSGRERPGLRPDRIIQSVPRSAAYRDLVDVYRILAARSDYPLHLGLSASAIGDQGIVASTAGLAILLDQGIGRDTMSASR